MKNYKIKQENNAFEKSISVVFIFFIVFLIVYMVTLSWFGNEDYVENIVTMGEVKIDVTTTPSLSTYFSNAQNPVYLEPNKTYALTTTIKSVASNPKGVQPKNVGNAYIRAKIETTPKLQVWDETTQSFKNVNIVIPIYDTSKWVPDSNNEWYYYKGYINNDPSTIATFTTSIQVVETLPNSLQGQLIKIKLTVHSIQRQYEVYIGDEKWSNIPQSWLNWAATDNWQA